MEYMESKMQDQITGSLMKQEELQSVVFWDCDENAELLSHESIDEAIEHRLDSLLDLSGTVLVYGYSRLVVDRKVFRNVVLESAQEFLDENYGGEDGHDTLPQTEVALDNFIDTYINGFTPWRCEKVETREVDIKEWVEKNAPDWLESTKEVVV